MKVDYVSVTQYLRKKGFLQQLCFCHAMYEYFVSRLCHTKKDFQITVSFQTKYDGIFKKKKRKDLNQQRTANDNTASLHRI